MPQNTDCSPGLQAPRFWLLAAVVPLGAQTHSWGKLFWLWTLRTHYPLFPISQVFNLKTQSSQTLHQDLLGLNPNSEHVTLCEFLSHFVGWWNTCLPERCLYTESLCIYIHFYISHVDKLRLMLAPITNGSVDSMPLKWKIFIDKRLQIQQKEETRAETQIAGTQWHKRWRIFHAWRLVSCNKPPLFIAEDREPCRIHHQASFFAAPSEWGFPLKSQAVHDNPHQVLGLTFPGPLCHEPKMRSSKKWNGI